MNTPRRGWAAIVRQVTRSAGVVFTVAALGWDCSGNGGTGASDQVSVVSVAPHDASIFVGASLQLSASAANSAGAPVECAFSWSSSPASVATVSGSGLVAGVSPGVATVAAACEGRSGLAIITVNPLPVASVSVAPSAVTLQIGGTTQLAAVARDSLGNALSGRSFSWSSSSLPVATVTQSGLVTAVASGSCTITATSEGRSGTATITVAPPPDYPNQPTGFASLSDRRFDALGAEAGWAGSANAQFTIVQDSTAPKSPPNVAQAVIPAGSPAGEFYASTSIDATPQTFTAVYMSFWLQISSNFVGHSSNVNKIAFFWIHDNPAVFANVDGAGTGTLAPSIRFQNGPSTSTGLITLRPNRTAAEIVRGRWHRWEVLLVANTADNFDGVVRVWFDGTLVTEYTDVRFSTSTQARIWQTIQFRPIWGGIGGTAPEDMYMRVDHFYVGGRQ